jgi:hypothetical protein
VAVKKPFAQRGWVRMFAAFMVGVLVLAVTWWAYEGIDKQRNASKAASAQAQKLAAVEAWKGNLEPTLQSVGAVSGGASPQIATDVGTALGALAQGKDAGVKPAQLVSEADNLDKAAKILAGFKLADTIANHGFDEMETDLITTIQPEIVAALRSLAVAARMTALAIQDPSKADTLIPAAQKASSTGQDLLSRAWASYTNISTLAGIPPQVQQPLGAGGLPPGLGG